jgi:TPP-dependent 2-oxoacid decarboxylase
VKWLVGIAVCFGASWALAKYAKMDGITASVVGAGVGALAAQALVK